MREITCYARQLTISIIIIAAAPGPFLIPSQFCHNSHDKKARALTSGETTDETTLLTVKPERQRIHFQLAKRQAPQNASPFASPHLLSGHARTTAHLGTALWHWRDFSISHTSGIDISAR